MATCGSDDIYKSLESTSQEMSKLVETLSDLDLSVPAASIIEFKTNLTGLDETFSHLARRAKNAANSISSLSSVINKLDKAASKGKSKAANNQSTQKGSLLFNPYANSSRENALSAIKGSAKPEKKKDYYKQFKDLLVNPNSLNQQAESSLKTQFFDQASPVSANNFVSRMDRMGAYMPGVFNRVSEVAEESGGQLQGKQIERIMSTLAKGNPQTLNRFNKGELKTLEKEIKEVANNTGDTSKHIENLATGVTSENKRRDLPGSSFDPLTVGLAGAAATAGVASSIYRANVLNVPYSAEEQAATRSSNYSILGGSAGGLAGIGLAGALAAAPISAGGSLLAYGGAIATAGGVGAMLGSTAGEAEAKQLNFEELSRRYYGADEDITRGNISAERLGFLRDVKYQNALVSPNTEGLARFASSDTMRGYRELEIKDALNATHLNPQQVASSMAKFDRMNRLGASIGATQMKDIASSTGLGLNQVSDIAEQFSTTSEFKTSSPEDRAQMIEDYNRLSETSPSLAQGQMGFEKSGFVGKSVADAYAKSLFGSDSYTDLLKQASDEEGRSALNKRLMRVTGTDNMKDALDIGRDVFSQSPLMQGVIDALGGKTGKETKTSEEYLEGILKALEKLVKQGQQVEKKEGDAKVEKRREAVKESGLGISPYAGFVR